ncbi:50S ribosomal protein L33 [Mycoplasmopsis anatis]|nr:50S ribosomal protein L33 [Mycoplasmopsis anatis]
MSKQKITLSCSICRRKNYQTNKSGGNLERIVINKHCTNCKTHTEHREEK